MNSCIYEGQVRHRRRGQVRHGFRYKIFMMYLDLAEIPRLFRGRWFWSARRAAPARFRREDHLGDVSRPLDQCVRDLVESRTGVRPGGPIRLLTHLRYFGHCFNPVSFYYCFDEEDEQVECVVAEVNNTPWGERHCYVLPASADRRIGSASHHERPKEFHVSPFLPMDMDYRWRFVDPASNLIVHMENHRGGERVFDATLTLARKEITGPRLAWMLIRYPAITVTVILRIHWQALRLWLKGAPFHPHPEKLRTSPEETLESR
jgi:DUF1365 family protein